MIGIIMAGGIGTRFWPLSKPECPKQYLSLFGKRSMIQMTYDRLRPIAREVYVVTSADQAHLVQQHLPELGERHVIVEPFGRNTAPCVALSAAWLQSHGVPENEAMLVVAADHRIGKVEEFHRVARQAEQLAARGYLVTFGIVPTYPATGYGYIESGSGVGNGMFHVKQFKEKPDRETAESFLARGGFYWNSGMFVWLLGTILSAYEQHMPEVNELLGEITQRWQQDGFDTDIASIYDRMPRVPVDIGIMERAENCAVVPACIDWSDVGGWQALYDLAPKDDQANAGAGPRTALDATGCYVRAQKPVALVGVHDLVIVETDDAILVCRRDQSERVKELAAKR